MNNLGSRLQIALNLKGFTQEDLANIVGISQTAVSDIIIGKTKRPRNLIDIAKALEVSAEWLMIGEGQAPGFAPSLPAVMEVKNRIEVLDVSASGGAGTLLSSDTAQEISAIEYNEAAFARIFAGYHPEDIKLINVKGDSMEPTLNSGDLIFVHTRTCSFEGDGVYVFSYGEHLYVKRLQMAGDTLRVISDNAFYPVWEINEKNSDRFTVHGKVLVVQSQQIKRFW